MTKRVKKQYTQYKFEFERWDNIGALEDFLSNLEKKKWDINGRTVNVKTSYTIANEIKTGKYANIPDTIAFEHQWNLYRSARRAYEDKNACERR